MTKTKRVIGYVRVSVDREEKVSPAMQREAIEAQCKAKGWTLVDVIVERGKSAGQGKRRPGLDKAMALIRGGAANTLMVWKVDRCTRSVRDFANLWDALGSAEFVSITESFDTTTPMGRAMLQITVVFAELERERSVERTNEWHGHRVRKGATPTAKAPMGYVKSRNALAIDPQTAPVVREAAKRVLAGDSIRSTARWMTGEGVPVSHHGLACAFRSPTMCGRREVGGVLLPIEMPEMWGLDTHYELVQLLTEEGRTTRPTHGQRRWMLAGIAQCSTCDRGMQMKPHVAGARYHCPECHRSIRCTVLEDYVAGLLLDTVDAEAWEAMRARSTVAPAVDVEAIEADLATLAADWASGTITRGEWDAARTVLVRRIEEAGAPVEADLVLPDVEDLAEAWTELDVDARRLVLAAVFTNVLIDGAPSGAPCPAERRVRPTWRV